MEQLEHQLLYVNMLKVKMLGEWSETQPHGAFTHGLSSKWNYLLRVTDWEENQLDHVLESLEKAIQSHFIPALTGQHPPGKQTREMLALPARLGGLGSHCLSKRAVRGFTTDQCLTSEPSHQPGPPVG